MGVVAVVVVVALTLTRITSTPWSQDRLQSLCSPRKDARTCQAIRIFT